jgi:hypothetical protein
MATSDDPGPLASGRDRGVVFGEVEVVSRPGFRVVDGVVEVDDNYPSKGTGERGTFFHDSEGNVIGLGEATHG